MSRSARPAGSRARYAPATRPAGEPPTLVELPAAPRSASPAPQLTSLHARKDRGPYGSAGYRGNCGGYLIRDLIQYYAPRRVLDPMTGSGTCRDVCRELGVPCVSMDIRLGHDAADPHLYEVIPTVDFVWLHPPYWRMIRYNDDARCLSNAPSLDAFVDRLRVVLRRSRSVLSRRGKIVVLIGGYSEGGRYLPLPALTVAAAAREGLRMACTEIIRFQYGNTSSRRAYTSRFIPGLYDQCLVFETDR